MWIGTERMGGKPGLIKYDAAKKEFKRVSALPGIIPRTMVMDSNEVLWIGTAEGLIAFKNDSVISTVTQNDGLLSNNINLLAVGEKGNVYSDLDSFSCCYCCYLY